MKIIFFFFLIIDDAAAGTACALCENPEETQVTHYNMFTYRYTTATVVAKFKHFVGT